MIEKIPSKIQNIATTFRNVNFKIYLVGGCVRDLLLNREVKDWDFTTDAKPEQILELYPDAFYDNTFGTVGIPLEDSGTGEKTIIEVTTFRTEKGYSNRRHPDEVMWGKTIEDDLSRRDFTINSIAIDLSSASFPLLEGEELEDEVRLIDPYGGQQDLKNKLIRAVGDPDVRFKEDALRLMRAVRIATQIGFSIEETTLKAITENAVLLNDIAKERIRDELLKILGIEYPYDGVMLLKNTGLLQYILSELLEGIGVSQERPGRHHKTDVFTHNVQSLNHCPSTDPIVRFATLIHDVGKPRVAAADEEGYVIFHNHEIVGAKIAAEIADRLRFSKKEKQKIVTLVRWHMFTVDEHITDSAVRRFIRRVGVENVKDMMDLRIGDRLGGGTQQAESWRLKLFKKRVEEQLAPAPFSINDLAIDGNDIMKELNIRPGKQVGEILQKLFEEVDEDLEKNNKEFLVKRVKEISV
jgi:tRNA nucleotidyltransferase (CCA-adding enzyme)